MINVAASLPDRPTTSQASRATGSTARQAWGLAGWFAATFVAAGAGAVASARAGAFYGQLVRPEWAPPPWLFGPVWSVLYVLIAVAAWRVWRVQTADRARPALALFVVQLAANGLWPWVFFVWHRGGLAMAEIAVLWCLVAATVLAFSRLDRLAAALMLPYLAWVSFASALTWSLWRLNPVLLG